MSRIRLILQCLAITIAIGAVSHVQPLFAADPKEKTIEGEVVDLSCYMSQGAKGADHMACGASCAKRGLPVGLVNAKGEAFTLLVSSASYAAFVSKPVRITGNVVGATLAPTKVEVKDGANWKVVEVK